MENIGQIISDKGSELLKNLIAMQENFIPEIMADIKSLNELHPTFAFSEIISKNIFKSTPTLGSTEYKSENNISKNIKLI